MTRSRKRKPHASTRRWPAWKRVPQFVPVPLRARRDGWTVARQGRFIGYLAETGSVAEAARRVGCSRETAYRLRRREGAGSFAAAWDAVLALRAGAKTAPARKVTPNELPVLAHEGAIRVRMVRGRFAVATRQPSNTALLRPLAAYDRVLRAVPAEWWP